MKYSDFSRLYKDAQRFCNIDITDYISEMGYQEWMGDYLPDDNTSFDATIIKNILYFIRELSTYNIEQLREREDLSMIDFCNRYEIPSRTLGSWENESKGVKRYMVMLIAYTVFEEVISVENFNQKNKFSNHNKS